MDSSDLGMADDHCGESGGDQHCHLEKIARLPACDFHKDCREDGNVVTLNSCDF